jgi:ribosomal subunit interface protein
MPLTLVDPLFISTLGRLTTLGKDHPCLSRVHAQGGKKLALSRTPEEMITMQTPLQITAHDMTLSETAEAEIREKAAKLELYYKRVISCHVVVGATVRSSHASHSQTGLYNVSIDLTVPGAELVVTRQANEELLVAIRDAFDAARRQLRDYARRQRGDVKTLETPPHAVVSQLFAKEGYGFLETPDGREIYFHSNSVLDPGFDQLEIGTEVRFAEEQGEKGPQASTVAIISNQ